VLTSNVRGGDRTFTGWQAIDDDEETFWSTTMAGCPPREPAGTAGQIKRFHVEGFAESAWRPLAEGTTIDGCRELRFPPVTVW
jgi:hypothetical protein